MSEVATRADALTERQMFEAAGVSGSMLNVIERASRDPAVDASKLRELLQIQREVEADQAKRSFTQAFHRLTKELPRVKKNGTIDLGGKGSIAFAKWEDVMTIIKPLMDREGFVLSFDTEERGKEGGGSVIVGELSHVDGHSRTARMSLPLDGGPGRNNLQAAGSTLSYGKRYVAEMLLNIVREGQDDDGKLGGTVFITLAQKDELIALIRDTKTDTKAFLQFTGTQSVDEIEAKNFAGAVQRLRQKLHKMQGEPA